MSHLPALTFDQILDGEGSPSEELVPLCMNGNLVRMYEEVAGRIAERAEAAAEAAAAGRKAHAEDPDVRLSSKPAGPAATPAPGERDPEQDEADRLIAEMKRYTVLFKLVNIGGAYQKLTEQHPPRRDVADAKLVDMRDREGFNTATFYPALVRACIAEPEITDARWDKLMNGKARISDAQFDRLVGAAVMVNRRDADLPFSLLDLGAPLR